MYNFEKKTVFSQFRQNLVIKFFFFVMCENY